tara:strand:- start:1189 stop:1290 length:102 start_codon:yes stop_codon:yes gene_type:complete
MRARRHNEQESLPDEKKVLPGVDLNNFYEIAKF